jgi:multicomponent Na+:H+ antiporter subunit B
MTSRQRLVLFGVADLGLGAFLVWALRGLPSFGHYAGRYGRLLNAVGLSERHASNIVAAIVFDFRGFDTMGEEFILFSSVMGVAFILRAKIRIKEQTPVDAMSNDATRVVGMLMFPVTLIMGLWLAAYGYVTPGGGFQGGVAIASAAVLLWIASSYRHYSRMTPVHPLDALEGTGAAAFVLVGIMGLGLDASFLANFLPLGRSGSLAAAGTIGLLNWASAIEVAAANVLLYREFFQEYVQTFPGAEEEE